MYITLIIIVKRLHIPAIRKYEAKTPKLDLVLS